MIPGTNPEFYFYKILLATATFIHLWIICGCFCTATAKLSSCNKTIWPQSPKYLSTDPLQKKLVNTSTRKSIRDKQAALLTWALIPHLCAGALWLHPETECALA